MSLDLAQDLAREAGQLLESYREKLQETDVQSKSDRRDLVTRADVESERLLVSRIRASFPGDAILAEEEVQEWQPKGRVWIIDPLDGTVNFVHGIRHYGVSIALYEDGAPLLGVVANPAQEEVFTAARGEGAFRNGKPLRVSDRNQLLDCVLATGFPYRRQELPNNNLENFNRLFLRVRGLRRMGVASLDLCYVAAGHFDGFWELHLKPFDVGAGALVVREAGGRVTDLRGGEDWLHGENILATNNHIHQELSQFLKA